MNRAIYGGPVFEMARQQFERVADHLQIPEMDRDRLLYSQLSRPEDFFRDDCCRDR